MGRVFKCMFCTLPVYLPTNTCPDSVAGSAGAQRAEGLGRRRLREVLSVKTTYGQKNPPQNEVSSII